MAKIESRRTLSSSEPTFSRPLSSAPRRCSTSGMTRSFDTMIESATDSTITMAVALSIMVSNDLVMPLVLQRRGALLSGRENVGSLLLKVRRLSIFAILLLAYMYYRLAGDAQLFAIGILAFAAIAQLAPAFFVGLFWRRATAGGAIAGMSAGILVWAY